ncbi:hypothetical protein QQ045_000484 [Rhodiola kirilowii]
MAPAPPSSANLAFPPLPHTTLHQPGHGNGPSQPGGDVVLNNKSPRNQVTKSSVVLEASDLPCLHLLTPPAAVMVDSGQPPVPGGSHRKTDANGVVARGGRTFAEVTQAGISAKEQPPPIGFQPSSLQRGNTASKMAELQVGVDFLRHTLVAKFSSGRPPIENIRSACTAAWGLDKCSIGALDARRILVVLDSEQEARKVLAHPNRKLGHSYFRIFRWTKDFSTKNESSTTSTWIRLMNLPPKMTNQGYIETISHPSADSSPWTSKPPPSLIHVTLGSVLRLTQPKLYLIRYGSTQEEMPGSGNR